MEEQCENVFFLIITKKYINIITIFNFEKIFRDREWLTSWLDCPVWGPGLGK